MTQTETRTGDTPMNLLGAYGQAVADGDVNDFDPHIERISFLYGLPDPASLPAADVAAAAVAALESQGHIALQYGRVGGVPRTGKLSAGEAEAHADDGRTRRRLSCSRRAVHRRSRRSRNSW